MTFMLCLSLLDLLLLLAALVALPTVVFGSLAAAVIIGVRGRRERTIRLNLDGAEARPRHEPAR